MRNFLLAGAMSLAFFGSVSAIGQQAAPDDKKDVKPPDGKEATRSADNAVRLGPITVTATKREATLQDVPVSVSVTTADTIERAVIHDLIDLQTVVPSLKVQQFNAVGQTNFFIRGFGNGSGNDGIESSVGVFIDGVYRSRSSSALDDLPEVDRIEVLRGPQSTLFGKNVSAGAISIVTAKPQFAPAQTGEIGFGNYGLRRARASVTGPLSDTVAFRLSATRTVRDGYLTNTTTGSDVNDRDRWSVRGDLLWNPSAALSLRVITDYNKINETCCGVVTLLNGPATQFIGLGLGRPVGSSDARFDDNIIFNTDPVNRLSGKGISVQADWKSDVGTLTSITAYRKQTNESTQDVDFTGADLANKNQSSDAKTFTQELRLASGGKGLASWLVGGFYQKEKLHSGVDTRYGSEIRAYGDGLSGKVPAALLNALPPALQAALTGRSNIYALEFLQSLVTPSIRPGSTYFQSGQGIADFYAMDQDFYSIFGNLDFKITDRLTLSGGAAYMNDRKRTASDVTLQDPFASLNLQNVPQFGAIGLPPGLYGALGGLQNFYANTTNHAPVNFPNTSESGELKGDKLTGLVRAAYDFGGANVYANYSTGWKAGAYNLSSDSRPPNANGVGRTAGPEEVELYEAGFKTTFRGGFLNLAVFKQSVKGFQSNAYTGTGYSLVNAGKQSTRGFEVDAGYAPARWLALTGSATYLDPKYDSFTSAPCVTFDTVRCPINPATGLTPNFRDLSGARPAGIPKWSVSASATLSKDFDAFGSYLRLAWDYASKTALTETTPEAIATYGTNNLNASLGFIMGNIGQYELMFWAHNLTDNRTIVASFPTVAQPGSYSGFPNQPRTFGATFRVKF